MTGLVLQHNFHLLNLPLYTKSFISRLQITFLLLLFMDRFTYIKPFIATTKRTGACISAKSFWKLLCDTSWYCEDYALDKTQRTLFFFINNNNLYQVTLNMSRLVKWCCSLSLQNTSSVESMLAYKTSAAK